MQPLTITPEEVEKLKLRVPAYEALAARYRDDAALRSQVEDGEVADFLSEIGIALPPGIEARVVANTADTYHVVLPPDPNVKLSDESLSAVAGGKSAGSAASVGTAGTLACACLASSVSTAGTAGTAGSAS